jgi:hypothetical protein
MGMESGGAGGDRVRAFCDRTGQKDGTRAAQNLDIKILIRPKGQAIDDRR